MSPLIGDSVPEPLGFIACCQACNRTARERLALPAILAGFVLSFLEALELFGPPAFLMIPAREQVMTTQLYLFFSEFPPRIEVAAAYAMPLLLVTVTLLWVQRRLLGRRRFVTVSGKGGVRRRMALGRWRWVMQAGGVIKPHEPLVFVVDLKKIG